jgi:hypothetical protein
MKITEALTEVNFFKTQNEGVHIYLETVEYFSMGKITNYLYT